METLAKYIKLHKEPALNRPFMVGAWPGRSDVPTKAVDYLRIKSDAELFCEVERYDLYPIGEAPIDGNILRDLEFPQPPTDKFYYWKGKKDLIIFSGVSQSPSWYVISELVLDIAERFEVETIFTLSTVTVPIHHTQESGVWAALTHPELVQYVKAHGITPREEALRRYFADAKVSGGIGGLNGLLLTLAKKRNLKGICLEGEIPDHIANYYQPRGAIISYPRASKALLQSLVKMLGIKIAMSELNEDIKYKDREIEEWYGKLPPPIREMIDKQISRLSADELLEEAEDIFKKEKD